MLKTVLKKSRKIVAMTLAMIMAFTLYVPAAAEEQNKDSLGNLDDIQNFNDYNCLNNFLNSYMNFICISKGNLSIDAKEATKYYETDKSVEYIYLDYTIKRRLAQIDDLRYKIINHSVDIKNVEKKNDLYYVSLEDLTRMNYECVENQESEELIYHYIVLKSQGDSFKIVTDNDYDELREELGITDNATVDQITKKANEALKKEKEEIKIEEQNYLNSVKNNNEDEDNYGIDENEDEVPAAKAGQFSYHKYKRNAAYKYAFKYYRNPNPAYVNFEQMEIGLQKLMFYYLKILIMC